MELSDKFLNLNSFEFNGHVSDRMNKVPNLVTTFSIKPENFSRSCKKSSTLPEMKKPLFNFGRSRHQKVHTIVVGQLFWQESRQQATNSL